MDISKERKFQNAEVIASARRLQQQRRRRMMIFTLLIGLFFVWLFKTILYDNKRFEITCYEIENEKITEPVRLIILSDLHNMQFGRKNKKLISAIKEQEPDAILMAGDMINSFDKNISTIVELCSRLTEIAPVYYILGNHEGTLMYTGYKIPLDQYLHDLGVHFLYTGSESAELNGNMFEIGAVACTSHTYGEEEKRFVEEFETRDSFKILMVHYPAFFTDKLNQAAIDLGIAGHYHGGLIRIPGIGGLYHTDTGFFPKYSGGKYTLGTYELIVSRGLGNHNWVPRINNKPELVVVDIKSSTIKD